MCADFKMAKVWIILAVTASISLVSANECPAMETIMNCNECFRCGGHWCKDPKEEIHCFQSVDESWCSDYAEKPVTGNIFDEPGDLLNPKIAERSVRVFGSGSFRIKFKADSVPTVEATIVNTTQNNDFDVMHNTMCKKGACTTIVDASPKSSFCSPTSRVMEYVELKITFGGLSEEATVKYNVPCACECSDTVEKHARMCNGRGDLSCGVCICQSGWTGRNCEKPVCEAKRGDVQCDNPNNNLECSGNGVCGPCETCICDTNRAGSRYFDKDYYCADICMTVNECDVCLRDPRPGRCPHCHNPLFYQNFNESLLSERDDLNRSIWIMCNETLPNGYYVEYFAMRDERRDTYFMIPSTTNAAIGAGGVDVTVPVAIIAALVVAAAAAVVAYKVWKNRVPPVPLNNSMYTNIDAEDCTGENPTYKSPISSFKNPTYGKW